MIEAQSRRTRRALLSGALGTVMSLLPVFGTERVFTYSYEPETMPKGGMEIEQWVSLREGRNNAVGQEDYRKWEFREESEYGLTDTYTISLYINESLERYHDPLANGNFSDFRFDGVSLENKYLVLNPADHPVGLALYVEPQIAAHGAEVEEKIILGQRHGDWKWALNLTHATEWQDDFHETEGEVDISAGISRQLSPRWSLGLEARDHNELPRYEKWENTALYVGPVVSYRQEKWWATLTVMPQVYGANYGGDPDGNSHLDLEGHERWNARLILGFNF